MLNFGQALKAKWPGWVTLEAPLAPLTTLGLGGRALALAGPETQSDLVELLKWCATENKPYFVLGGGSNILFPDNGFPGLIIRLGAGFNWLARADKTSLGAGAATLTPKLVAFAAEHGASGLEPLSGVPGFVGGALQMNAGGATGAIGTLIKSMTWVTRDGEVVEKPAADLSFGYRGLESLPAGAVITQASWNLPEENPETIKFAVRDLMDRRKASQPKGPSAGCVFKNPVGKPAGKLIEEAGLKGLKKGGALISPIHGNFIICEGPAKAADVLALIGEIRTRVWELFGVKLQLELKTPGLEDTGEGGLK